MATQDQLNIARRGGGRVRMSKHSALTMVTGHVGVTGFGSITGGSGGTDGVYPLVLTGGTVSGGPAAGTMTVTSGAVASIALTSPGDYTVAPTGISTANIPGISGASVASVTTAEIGFDASFSPPAGSRISGFRLTNPTAASGSPTNVNVTVGKTFGGAEYVAAVDLKAQGATDLTLVGSGLADLINWPGGPLYIQAKVVGNTTSGAVMTCETFYSPPNP